MPQSLERFYEQRAYIGASLALLAAALFLPVSIAALDGPSWLGSSLGLVAYILLAIVTHGRLRDAALSAGWIILLLAPSNVGPIWDGPEPLKLHLGNLILLIPLILGWTVPSREASEISPAAVASEVR